MQQILRDRNGKVIGSLKKLGGDLRLYNRDGIFMGLYRETNDHTYDRDGKMIGRGNIVITLLVNK